MALPVSPAVLHRFTPPRDEGVAVPTYLLKVPSLIERAAFRRDMQASGARYTPDAEILAHLRDGLAVFNPANRADLEDALTALEAAAETGEAAAPETLALVSDLETVLRQHYPPYAAALAERSFALEVQRVIACRHFLRGVEGADFTLTATGPLLPDAEIAKVPEDDRLFIAAEIFRLTQPTETQEKN